MNMHELLTVYSRRIEWKLDSLIEHEPSSEMRMNQIALKSILLGSIAETSIHPDPLAAAIDSWVLCYQLIDYFESERCSEIYGLACPEMQSLFSEYVVGYINGLSKYISEEDRASLRTYASRYPVQDDYLSRRSIIFEISNWISSDQLGIKGGLLSMPDLMRYMGNQLEYFSATMPKQVVWQMDKRLSALQADSMMILLTDMQRMLDASASLLENAEDIIRDNRDTLLSNLDYQRRVTLYMIRQERIETLKALTQERIEILNAIRQERLGIQNFVESQREAITSDVSSGSTGMMNQSGEMVRELIDYMFIRVLILGGLFAGVIFLAIWFYKKQSV